MMSNIRNEVNPEMVDSVGIGGEGRGRGTQST